jgi:hypothetical protein
VQQHLDAGNVYITLDILRAELVRIWTNAHSIAMPQCEISIRTSIFGVLLAVGVSLPRANP